MAINDFYMDYRPIGEECGCEMCKFMASRPAPSNRNERRQLEKEMKRKLKIRHEVHMVWVPLDGSVSNNEDDDEDGNDENELKEETAAKNHATPNRR